MFNDCRALILMGTYNGERFLEEQIRSIQAQTFEKWQMLIRDDGSSDGTVHLLNAFQEKDKRIKVLVDDKGNQGPSGNYNVLCAEAVGLDADIIFFSDQDDVWLPNKMETQVHVIRNLEKRHIKKVPMLVYTDLSVVDMQLKIINKSFLAFQGVKNIADEPLRVLLAQNFIPACASAINRTLLQIASPIPEKVLMHDWWIVLCAAACGKIEFIPQPMGLYRQHRKNAVGAKKLLDAINPLKSSITSRYQKGRENLVRSMGQAQQLKDRLQGRTPRLLNSEALSLINVFVECLNKGRVERIKEMRKHGICRQGLIYGTLFYLLLFFQKQQGRYEAF